MRHFISSAISQQSLSVEHALSPKMYIIRHTQYNYNLVFFLVIRYNGSNIRIDYYSVERLGDIFVTR